MHEYSIVAALIDEVAGHARGARVRRVQVCLGELSGVDAGLLATAFETFRARTICDGAELAIGTTPARWACPRCGRTLPTGARLSCPDCVVPARLAAGDEIVLERIEMEVPDV
jgi:hydrogenase nickel incorporation protein HypA/HybF